MMTMRSVFGSVGGAVDAALAGGMLIIFGSYQAVGISFGIMSWASAGAFLLTETPQNDPQQTINTLDNACLTSLGRIPR